MRLTVIGFWGGYPGANEATSGYLLESGDFRLLIDCGSGVLAQLQNKISVNELDSVILSHYHADHIADVGSLQYAKLISSFINNNQKILPVYGHTYDKEEFAKLTHKNSTNGIGYSPDQQQKIGPFTIEFLKTTHPVDCFAMRITDGQATIVYTADSSYQQSFVEFSKDADLLISECNFYAHQDGTNAGHMNSLEVGELAKNANVKQVLLTHLPHFGNHEDLVKEAGTVYTGKIELAHTFYEWSL
ncbi:MBL fold metallo-hydrolase [Metabacillus fastidiosus]|uniref:MBL fold metallo-hydrolase n=1 Tax=Metabacillus fastidiosus TaxID=1458 RepID=UPI003D2CA540